MIIRKNAYLLLLLVFYSMGLQSVMGQSSNAKPFTAYATYRVTVDSVERKANNYTVTLVFENLTDETLDLEWLKNGFVWGNSVSPYLTDERGRKYMLEDDSNGMLGGIQLLQRTKLKTRFLFYGEGGGETFTLNAIENNRQNRHIPITISNIKITTDEVRIEKKVPTVVTERYRATVESAVRRGDDVIVTIIFESLVEKPFSLSWGSGTVDTAGVMTRTEEPYLIDENADRFYLRKRDSGKVVSIGSWQRDESVLPKTRLKTDFTFRAPGQSRTFTFGCVEHSPKQGRPIVIENIQIQN